MNNKRTIIKRQGSLYSLTFIRPKNKTNAQSVADELMSLHCVEEVILSSGEYGFIVRSRFDEKENRLLHNYITRKHDGKFSMVSCYYKFKKYSLR